MKRPALAAAAAAAAASVAGAAVALGLELEEEDDDEEAAAARAMASLSRVGGSGLGALSANAIVDGEEEMGVACSALGAGPCGGAPPESLAGRVVVVTGATGGLGRSLARDLAPLRQRRPPLLRTHPARHRPAATPNFRRSPPEAEFGSP